MARLRRKASNEGAPSQLSAAARALIRRAAAMRAATGEGEIGEGETADGPSVEVGPKRGNYDLNAVRAFYRQHFGD